MSNTLNNEPIKKKRGRPRKSEIKRRGGARPDTSLHLGEARREWLKAQGGIQPTIAKLIDQAMQNGC